MGESYTRYPRPILWLLREGVGTIGGPEPDGRPPFPAPVRSFYLGKLPVTNEQYEAYDRGFVRSAVSPADDDPATGISFVEASGYCAWYARVSRKPIRLPTEIEWEYACRACTTGRYFFGDDPDAADAWVWHRGNSGGRVGRLRDKRPNPFGLLGMLGGAWEWTSSLYLPYPAADGDGREDPQGTGRRVLRGGSFRVPLTAMGSGVRRPCDPHERRDDTGFRIARSFDSGSGAAGEDDL